MRLERLEIKGFKSFANQTTIHFKEDVTGVVGPNGSGKSNIVDAIRWVLGEQKQKDLRLEKMSDVIFNGTSKKKAGGMAFVSLTFENSKKILSSEYNTVTIGRYLYKTGESEYRLNNVPCRLKDIRSLFLDTGIGSNSYAIIALGMVEDILADKENARRRMFEQAAGISKYKSRKRETILKLNNTQADLDRVEDLLFEIEKNLKTLEKQAKRTQKYFDLKEQYKELSLDLAVLKTKDLRENYRQISTGITTEEDLLRQLEVDLRNEDARVEDLKKKHLDKEKSLSEFQRSMNELINNIRTWENDKKILEQKQEFEEHNQTILTNRIERNGIRIKEYGQQIIRHESDLAEMREAENRLQTDLTSLREILESNRATHGSAKASVDQANQKFESQQNALVNLEKELAVVESTITTHEQETERLRDELRSRSQHYQDLDTELKAHQEKVAIKSEEVTHLEEHAFKCAEERGEFEKQEDALLKSLSDLRRAYDAKNHERELLKSLVDKLEGFPDSIKYLNKNFKWKKPARLFSDLLYCKEEYRTVVEHYLEDYLNYYVVASLDEAAQAIRVLADSQKGRANFFILDTFKAHTTSRKAPVGATAAADVVEYDKKYALLIEHLLHDVYIVDYSSDQKSILDQEEEGIVVLSLDGRFVRRQNALGGGSVGLFEGKKLGRKKNLKLLEKELDKLSARIASEEKELDAINDKLAELDVNEKPEVLDAERQVLEELRRQEVYLKSRFEHLEDQESGTKSLLQSLGEKLSELRENRSGFEENIARTRVSMQEERLALDGVDSSYDEIARQLADQTAEVNEKQIELIRLQGKISATEKEYEFASSQDTSLRSNLDQDTVDQNTGQESLTKIGAEISELAAALLGYYEQRKENEKDLTGLEQTYYEARSEISAAEEKVRTLHRSQSEKQQLINHLKDQFTEIKFGMNNVAERLKIEFDISLDQILEQHDPSDHQLDQLEVQVEKIRLRIANFGEINPMAVAAYDEMHERYEAITQQRDDVLDARNSLLETIQEIEETATARFMEAFSSVRLHFQNVFRSLFTEDDTCDLILLDVENPLTSTIEIIAKPKGKRPKSISQLSGGEKTLTAIALLFGLYLLKPAPFCIFDEVDAPLDDANVEKFNRIIKEFSKDSQFIIVTHNKLTMAAVDVIYGVYMEEQGVSGVTEVDFRDFEHSSFLEEVN